MSAAAQTTSVPFTLMVPLAANSVVPVLTAAWVVPAVRPRAVRSAAPPAMVMSSVLDSLISPPSLVAVRPLILAALILPTTASMSSAARKSTFLPFKVTLLSTAPAKPAPVTDAFF
ncbi:hypothetical protein D3C76_1567130 [compost metagenome]